MPQDVMEHDISPTNISTNHTQQHSRPIVLRFVISPHQVTDWQTNNQATFHEILVRICHMLS